MSVTVASALGTMTLFAWAAAYPWIRRATGGGAVLGRFAYALAIPAAGLGATAVALRGFGALPYLILIAVAGSAAALALRRLRRSAPSDHA